LALGQCDIIAESGLKLWDWAAIQPVIEGAGGRLTDWRGEPLRPDSPGEVLAVGDARLLGPAIAALQAAG
jgi:myo-inositol-1(or 4)-monophosphatase